MTTSVASPLPELRSSLEHIPTSLIREVAHAGMGKEGVIPLWFGEPTMPTPGFICDAACRALADGDTFYQANRGLPELQSALVTTPTRSTAHQFVMIMSPSRRQA